MYEKKRFYYTYKTEKQFSDHIIFKKSYDIRISLFRCTHYLLSLIFPGKHFIGQRTHAIRSLYNVRHFPINHVKMLLNCNYENCA